MLPSQQQSEKPVRPTRLAKRSQTGGSFRALVYYLKHQDLFITINYTAEPETFDWIVVAHPENEPPLIELYEDQQSYIGVVEVMDFMQLENSQQWTHPFFHW